MSESSEAMNHGWPSQFAFDGYVREHEWPPDAWYVSASFSHGRSYRSLTLPLPMWKDLKWARSSQDVCNPLSPLMGWHLPVLCLLRYSPVDPIQFRLTWRPLRTWRVRR